MLSMTLALNRRVLLSGSKMKVKDLKNKDKLMDIFINKLKREFRDGLKKIILFGSRARGDHTKDSDYDLILLFDTVTDELKKRLNEIEADMLLNYGTVITAIPYTNEDVKKRKFQPLFLNIEKEGLVLWRKRSRRQTLKE